MTVKSLEPITAELLRFAADMSVLSRITGVHLNPIKNQYSGFGNALRDAAIVAAVGTGAGALGVGPMAGMMGGAAATGGIDTASGLMIPANAGAAAGAAATGGIDTASGLTIPANAGASQAFPYASMGRALMGIGQQHAGGSNQQPAPNYLKTPEQMLAESLLLQSYNPPGG